LLTNIDNFRNESLVALSQSDNTIYLTIMSLGNVTVGTIMTVSSVFQGLGKTYPTLMAAIFDNVLFASLVFTLPGTFGWGIQAVWWIKLLTAIIEMVIVSAWLRRDLQQFRSTLP